MAGYPGGGAGMSTKSNSEPGPPGAIDGLRPVLDGWMETLAQVLESMTDQRPAVVWQPTGRPAAPATGAETEMLWWEQPLEGAADSIVWVGAPAQTWQHAGTLTLKAAGLETVGASEAHSTWLEILSQSLSVLARSVTAILGGEVLCEGGTERPSAPDARDWVSVTVAFGELSLPPLLIAFSPGLVGFLASPPHKASPEATAPPTRESGVTEQPVKTSRTMELLLDVELPVSISFGKTRLPLRDVLKLTTGSIVELNRTATDPVDVLVNQRLIARGEVVVVEGNYGVRIQEIASRQDRLRSIP